MTTWVHRATGDGQAGGGKAGDGQAGDGPRLAVKDVFEVAGLPVGAGSRAYARRHPRPASQDSAVVAAMRAAGAQVVGTTTMHELATGRTGVNPWFGTPRNPLDPAVVPGGSSGGSAVAVADDEADVGLGTDTGGSVRVPAACCGVAGLKTTWGRLSREGMVPAAPSLDTVGFLARDVGGLVTAMRLVEARFATPAPGPAGSPRVGRVSGLADDVLDRAVEHALAAVGWAVAELTLPTFSAAEEANYTINVAEVYRLHGWVLDHPDEVGSDVAAKLEDGAAVSAAGLSAAWATADRWRTELAGVFEAVDLVALPTLARLPPKLDDADGIAQWGALTRPANLAGVPALAVPLPGGPGFSLQLLAPEHGEAALLAAGLAVEQALGR